VSLVARHLEHAGLPTVVLGSARDIVEHCGVPRFLFTDLPLGNPCGHPWAADEQRRIVRLALELLETAKESRTIAQAPIVWSADFGWKERYALVDPQRLEHYRSLGKARRAAQRAASRRGDDSAASPVDDPLGSDRQID